MEGLIILTGVEVAGLGVVPLGVTTGVDCTVGDCLDRVGNAAAFDGVVNGGQVCTTNAGPNEIPCPPGVPATVANGHVGLFYAPPTGPLMHQRPITALVALPISSAKIPDTNIRATTLLYWQTPDQIDTTFAVFPVAPRPPAQLGNRTYTLAAISSDIDIDFVTLQGLPDPTLFRQHWTVYLAAGVGTFTAPAVPAGMADPLAEPNVRVAHVGFVTQAGTTLDTLVRNDDTTLAELAHQTVGVTFEQRDVPNP